jgi:hypothetical protein
MQSAEIQEVLNSRGWPKSKTVSVTEAHSSFTADNRISPKLVVLQFLLPVKYLASTERSGVERNLAAAAKRYFIEGMAVQKQIRDSNELAAQHWEVVLDGDYDVTKSTILGRGLWDNSSSKDVPGIYVKAPTETEQKELLEACKGVGVLAHTNAAGELGEGFELNFKPLETMITEKCLAALDELYGEQWMHHADGEREMVKKIRDMVAFVGNGKLVVNKLDGTIPQREGAGPTVMPADVTVIDSMPLSILWHQRHSNQR